jgi:hypothetical protein
MGIRISRGADENGVFKRFLQTQPDLALMRWRYDGAHHERPDFVLLKERIGVELGEWLDPKQTKAARELERFEEEINEAAKRQDLTEFRKSFEPTPNARYGVIVQVRRVPSRCDKMPVVEALLVHLRTAKKPASGRERRFGVGTGPAEMPKNLSPFLSFIRIYEAASSVNLGISVARGGSFNPNDAVDALLALVRDKLERKRHRYEQTKTAKGLRQLWLLLHYGRGMRWNTPYDGLGLAEGRPLDEPTNRQIIGERVRKLIAEIGTGPFDRMFLLFDMTPGFQCMELFP